MCFSCILRYFTSFQPPSGKVPDRFSYHQFFDKLTTTYWTNFRLKICLELISSKHRIFWSCFSCILRYFSPFEPPSGNVPDRFSWHQFSYKLTATYWTNFRHKICLELISSKDRIFWRRFSCILRYFTPFQPPSGKVPDWFSYHQFFYKLTRTYWTNFRHKICLELISSKHRIFWTCFSCILRYYSPF